MVGRLIQTAKFAYQYPLIFKQLWHTPRVQAPDQEIVYRDLKRFTYREIRERIGRLASALSKAGVVPGDTVGVLDWDSHRFLEFEAQALLTRLNRVKPFALQMTSVPAAAVSVAAQDAIIFNLPAEERLSAAMQLLGVSYATLADEAGHA